VEVLTNNKRSPPPMTYSVGDHSEENEATISLKSQSPKNEDPKKTLAIDLQEGYVSEDYAFK
jgi:hypothetical protein